MLIRGMILSCALIMVIAGYSTAQDAATNQDLTPPTQTDAAAQPATDAAAQPPADAAAQPPAVAAAQPPADAAAQPEGGNSAVGVDSSLSQANQAFLALYGRQFVLAKQQYEQAVTSNPEYKKMVDLCQNIQDRMRDLSSEYMDIFGKVMSPNFRMETLKKEEVDRMLEFQMRQNQAGQTLGELGLIADIPVSDLGLDFEGAEQLSLGEYLMWIKPRSANERIWYRARKRIMERSLTYTKQEVRQQQRQEKYSRLEESRRRRLDRQGQGNMGIGGGMGGGDFGGMMGGGMGGGMGMGGMGMGMGGMGMGGGMGF